MALRDYQQAAHDAAIDHIKKCLDSCVIEAATGAGKSHIIAALADTLHTLSKGKHILCIAPSAELVTQNREKYLATGNPASVMSASAGGKCWRHPVVFGTPGTIKNSIKKVAGKFCAIIIDECHGITPTIKKIVDDIKESNPNLRVIGLSATPYRLGTGYVYDLDEKNKKLGEQAYFKKKVYSVYARDLIDRGFLTPPMVGSINDNYDTINMQTNSMGKFKKEDVDRAYTGQGRKTASIIADVVAKSKDRQGVIVFAATVQHAHECLASLPPELSAIVHGGTSKNERADILKRFKSKQIKYLVNVSVLTTGFDAPHIDVVALLRATESVSLMQQMIGRGLRISDSKNDCLVLDYAQNIERHCPDGDLFNPEIETSYQGNGESETVKAICEQCNYQNEFIGRPNDSGYAIDDYGFFVDLSGTRIETDFGFMPAHMGRRCKNHYIAGGRLNQCTYRWTFKECSQCHFENDIAARYCSECKFEIVDPNEKLVNDFKALKKDPTKMQTDKVAHWTLRNVVSKAGNECLKIDFVTEYRSFSVWLQKNASNQRARNDMALFNAKTNGGQWQPKTVTYIKEPSGFFKIYDYNKEEDKCEIP